MNSNKVLCKACNNSYCSYSAFKKHLVLGRCKRGSDLVLHSAQNVVSSPQIVCPKCSKEFHNKSNLNRHCKTACKSKRLKDLLNNQDNNTLIEQLLEILVKNTGNNTGNNTTTNNNHGTINNTHNTHNTQNIQHILNQNTLNQNTLNQSFHIHPLGQETLDHITEDRKIAILKKGLGAIGELYEAILEHPENWNVAITDKRNKKVTYKNRDGKITIGDLKRVLNMIATDNIDRIDEYLDKYHDKLTIKDKTIIRLMDAQGYRLPGEDSTDNSPVDDKLFEDYYLRCENIIFDILELNKSKMSKRLKKYVANLELAIN